jgi:bis(5'-nucleosyl)-tetraphosphatase (symmetrical)
LLQRNNNLVLVHAGLLPAWTVDDAEREARALEAELKSPGAAALLGALPPALEAFTRLRVVDASGRPLRGFDGPPDEAPPGCTPWYDAPDRRWRGRAVFGHWSALGLYVSDEAVCLDTGCVWGRSLTALRFDDGSIVQEPTADEDRLR